MTHIELQELETTGVSGLYFICYRSTTHQGLFILPPKACTNSSPAYQVPRATLSPFCRYLWPCDPNGLIWWTLVESQAFRVFQFSAKSVGLWHLCLEYSLKIGNLVSVIFTFQKHVKKSHVMRHENVLKVEQLFTVSQNRVFLCSPLEYFSLN